MKWFANAFFVVQCEVCMARTCDHASFMGVVRLNTCRLSLNWTSCFELNPQGLGHGHASYIPERVRVSNMSVFWFKKNIS